MGNFTSLQMFVNPRRGRQTRNFTTNVPKILDLKSSSQQIFSENCRWVPLFVVVAANNQSMIGEENTDLDVPEESPCKVSFSFALFFVCRSLFENRKPCDFSLTSPLYVCIFIPALCPRLTEKNQCSFRAHSKKRFPLGVYSRLRKVSECITNCKRNWSVMRKLKQCRRNFTEYKSEFVIRNGRQLS